LAVDFVEMILKYRQGFAAGLTVTLQLAGITWAIGLSVGSIVGAAAYFHPRAVGWPLRGCALFLSGVPFLVMLYWAHYPLQVLLGVVIVPFVTAAALLSLINTVLVAEIWRAALNDFPREYVVAARVSGLTQLEAIRFIQFPILLKATLPMLLATQVAMLQLTLFASLISVEELFRVAQRINSEIQQPILIYTALAAFFLVLTLPIYAAALVLRRRYTRDLSER
jgi:polar amino acid transport system permease protein